MKKILLKLLEMFSKPKQWNLEEGHIVELAFTDRGRKYYKLLDMWNTYSQRGLQALQVYEEWDMRLKKEDLQDFILGFETILRNQKSINIIEMVRLVEMLKERTQFPVPTEDIAYKFAAIMYFDENESPYKVDPDYIAKKIARWKEASSEVDHFFILQRHVDMLPLPQLSEDVLRKCLIAVEKVNASQLEYIQQLNSQESTSVDSSNVQ
jgi:hypothetical protein